MGKEERKARRSKRQTEEQLFNSAMTVMNTELSALDANDPDFHNKSMAIMQSVYNQYPQLKDDKRFAKIQKEFTRLLPQAVSGGQLLADIYDIVTNSKDINLSEAERAKLSPPNLPTPSDGRVIKDRLNQARLNESTAGATEQAVINRVTDDAYAQDLGNARIASTGQAASYGSYAQAASNRRARNRIAGQAQVRGAVDNATKRTDILANLDNKADERRFINETMNARLLEGRYARDQKYVDDLGKSGRQGKRNAIQNIVTPLANVATNAVAAGRNRPAVAPQGNPLFGNQGLSPYNAQFEAPQLNAPLQYNPTEWQSSALDSPDAMTNNFSQQNNIGDYYGQADWDRPGTRAGRYSDNNYNYNY